MVDNSREVRKQILDVIGCLAAVITIIAYVLLCINASWEFIPSTSLVFKILAVIKTWAPLIVVGIVGWEFVADKNFVVRVIYYVAIALVVVCMFFPGTWSQFVGIVNK